MHTEDTLVINAEPVEALETPDTAAEWLALIAALGALATAIINLVFS